MKKLLLALALFFVLALPVAAATVSWDRPATGIINPLFLLDTVRGNKFLATSTTAASIFPYASTTALTVSNVAGLTLSGITGSTQCLHLDTNGLVSGTGSDCTAAGTFAYPFTNRTFGLSNASATTTVLMASGGFTTGSTTIGSLVATSSVKFTSLTGGALAADATGLLYTFATSTWTFASSTLLADSNRFTGNNIFAASTTIGDGTRAGGLTVSGGATTTGTAYFAGNVGLGTTSPTYQSTIECNQTTNPCLYIVNDDVNNAGNVWFSSKRTGTGGLGIFRFLGFDSVGAEKQFAGFQGRADNLTAGSYEGSLAFLTASAGGAISEKMRITGTGTVGIGTTTPAKTLSVQGNGLFSGDLSTAALTATGTVTFSGLGSGLVRSTAGVLSVDTTTVEHHSFSLATSTAWTGTTTPRLEIGYGEVWNTVVCSTDVGTLNVHIGYGSASTTMFQASTTKGTITLTPNNTMTAGNLVMVDVGTPASAPTKLVCTVKDTF